MARERIEAKWIDAFAEVVERCAMSLDNQIVVDRGRRQGDLA